MLRHDGAGGAGGLRGGRLPPKNVGFGAVTVMVHVQVSSIILFKTAQAALLTVSNPVCEAG
ncbi:hypothetical protein CHELA41_51468 [Hyphomicrobiales bacterium]|nr:hypothetical protein CHELA41_51468 [Hyphomicrobiales bacterium]